MLSLAFLKIPVTDLNRAVTFYTNALPLKVAFAAEEYGWAQLEAGDLSLALYVPGKGGGNRTPGGSVDFQLHHPNVDELLATFKENLPDANAEIFENNDGSRSLEFTGPDGNELKIMSG